MPANRVLIEKVEGFVRKFYLNRLIQGVLVGAAIWILFYLLINTLEYFSWFSPKVRFVLFLLLLLGSSFVVAYYFLWPMWNLIRFRKKMTVEQAALLIGRFFPDISDKLLNTIQLSQAADQAAGNDLLLATIEQRTQRLAPIRFSDAVDLKGNLKFLWIFLALSALLAGLMAFLPPFAVQPAQRIIHYSQHFEKPLPFKVTLSAAELECVQGSDLPFSILVEGSNIPDAFYVKSPIGQQRLEKYSVNEFHYLFRNLNHDFSFQIIGGDYVSSPIPVTVHPNPALLSYQCLVTYPSYIHRAPESFEGKTRIMVPQGSRLAFAFSVRDCDSAFVMLDSLSNALPMVGDQATFQFTAGHTMAFDFLAHNAHSSRFDPLRFVVDVLPDSYPDIRVESFDEAFSSDVYYSGLIADDYGFTKLTFNGKVSEPVERTIVLPVAFDRSLTRTSFFYRLNMDSLGLLPGQGLEVYFEVWDNDGFHGPKSKRSETFSYYKASQAQLDSVADQTEHEIISDMTQRSLEATKLKDDIEKMLQDLAAKKELDWSDKEKLKDIVRKQTELQEEWERLQDEQQKLTDFMKDHDIANEDLLKKQQKINELFDELIPDELKKMMEEIERLLDEMPREQMQKMLQDMNKDNNKLQELLDRNLSLLEQLRMEKNINELADKLQELGEELKQAQDENAKSAEEAKKEFEELMQTFDSLQEKNKDLNDPFNLQIDETLEESINEDLQEAADLENQNDSDASSEQEDSSDQEGSSGTSQSQQKQSAQQKKNSAGQKMQKMAENMLSMMSSGSEEQLAEDAHLIRILLENTLRASHQQEALMNAVGRLRSDDPSMSEKIAGQKSLADNFDMVKDSLKAMALRQPAIRSFVFDELSVIDRQTAIALKYMNDLYFSMAVSNQQVALQSMNNLALMLAESLQEMENSMSGQGSSMRRSKPNQTNKGQGMKQMEQLQQQLGEQLKQLQQKMQQPNGQMLSKELSEELARMAAEQEMLREGMQQMLNEMKQNGQVGDDGLNQIIKDMEKLEEDIVNKRITNQTLERNREILSRMLESEKAQQKRDQDEKRKSNEYKGSKFDRQIDELLYERSMKKNQEFLKQNPVQYQPYFKTKINEYYLKKNTL